MSGKSAKATVTSSQRQSAPAAPAASEPRPWWLSVLREPLALGLAPLVLIRPWLDGVTYPSDNFYFVWGVVVLFVLWGVRALMRGESLRYPVPTLVLFLFWLLGALSMAWTIQFNATYRSFLQWSSYFFLFVLAINGLRSRTAIAITLSACVFSFVVETTWSLIHFHYVLSYVRESVMQKPELLRMHFGTTSPSPELVHRLQVNRAFGSLLFPNALAAFLLLAIPFTLAEAWRAVRLLKARLNPDALKASPIECLLAALLTSLLLFAFVGTILWFIGSFSLPPSAVLYGPFYFSQTGVHMMSGGYVLLWLLLTVLLPAGAGYGAWRVVTRYGMDRFGVWVRAAVLPVLFVMECATLWLTYSRGGLMALMLATVVACVLLFPPKALLAWLPPARRMAAACLVLAVGLFAQFGMAQGGGADDPSMLMMQTPPAAPTSVAAPGMPSPAGAGITKEGQDLTMKDLANPASFWLRLTYWQTGIRMALDNLVLGVGLGNFGTAYPKYQAPGAGDSKTAHNDYLQALCETGILGFLLFTGFWLYFAVWGALRILSTPRGLERVSMIGLYIGVLAFLVHSLVDFNFYNPSLAFFVFLLAGLFYSRAAVDEAEPAKAAGFGRLVPVPLLAAASVVAAMTMCVFLCDYYVGNRSPLNVGNNRLMMTLYDTGDFFLRECGADRTKRPVVNIMSAAQLIPDRSVLETFGSIRVPAPDSPSRHRALGPKDPVPPNGFLVVTDQVKARLTARPYVDKWLETLEGIDSIFPYNPDIAAYFIQFYENLANAAQRVTVKQGYVLSMLRWAEEGVERSPYQSVFHEFLAKALWLRGNIEPIDTRREYYEKGLREYRLAAELYPSSPDTWQRYGDVLQRFGEALAESGDKDKGQQFLSEAQKAHECAKALWNAQSGA